VLVNNLQLFTLAEPLPQSICKKIVQDDFIDFEKLYTSMEKGYDHKDEPKTLVEGFTIVKKDQDAQFTLRLNGSASTVLGKQVLGFSSFTMLLSFNPTGRLLWSFSGQCLDSLKLWFNSMLRVSWAIGKFLILHFICFVTNYIFRY
jgi:hypothetical protein